MKAFTSFYLKVFFMKSREKAGGGGRQVRRTNKRGGIIKIGDKVLSYEDRK
jgi:hypothetical protein